MKTNTLLLVLMALLVVMAGAQAVQLAALSNAISSGTISGGHTAAAGGSGVLSQLAQASQVGGCG